MGHCYPSTVITREIVSFYFYMDIADVIFEKKWMKAWTCFKLWPQPKVEHGNAITHSLQSEGGT